MTAQISNLRTNVEQAVSSILAGAKPNTDQAKFEEDLAAALACIPKIDTSKMTDKVLRENLQAAIEWMENLNKRYEDLKITKVQYDTELKTAQDECTELFGTCDIQELRDMYNERHSNNQTMVSDFLAELMNFEAVVKSVEQTKSKVEATANA